MSEIFRDELTLAEKLDSGLTRIPYAVGMASVSSLVAIFGLQLVSRLITPNFDVTIGTGTFIAVNTTIALHLESLKRTRQFADLYKSKLTAIFETPHFDEISEGEFVDLDPKALDVTEDKIGQLKPEERQIVYREIGRIITPQQSPLNYFVRPNESSRDFKLRAKAYTTTIPQTYIHMLEIQNEVFQPFLVKGRKHYLQHVS